MKRWICLLLAGLLTLSLLAACSKEEPAPAPEYPKARNDGEPAQITLGYLPEETQPGEADVLSKIARKYQANYPYTTVSFVACENEPELRQGLQAGALDAVLLAGALEAEWVGQGLLMDFYDYLPGWEESATLTPAAQAVLFSQGAEHAYLMPHDFYQDVLYYRADRYAAFNEGKEENDRAYCRTWTHMLKADEQLGGCSLSFAGADKLADLFGAFVWSSITLGRTVDSAAGYFYPGEGGGTVFPLDKTAEAAEQFYQVMTRLALAEALEYDEEQALEAFLEGRADFLLANRRVMARLSQEMEAEQWAAAEFPRGLTSGAVFTPEEFTGWGVSARTEQWEKVLHFLFFLSNADNNTHLSKVCGTLPIQLPSLDFEPDLADTELAPELAMMKRSDWYKYAFPPTMYSAYEGWQEAAGDTLRAWIRGEKEQSSVLAEFDAYWADALAREGNLWQ